MLHDKFLTFLSFHGWGDAAFVPVSADWSPRQFFRLSRGGETAILLIYNEGRDYPGHEYNQTIAMTEWMHAAGLPVPAIIAKDDALGCVLVEDFGLVTIHDKPFAYHQAVSLLGDMTHISVNDWSLIPYQDGHVYNALQYFMRYSCDDESAVGAWMSCWDSLMRTYPDWPQIVTHMDYHAANLLIRDDGSLGMIDHQGARLAPLGYDLVNLIEDARIILPASLKHECIALYRARLPAGWGERLDTYLAILTTQFHIRVAGQIDYLATERGRSDLMVYRDGLMQRIKLGLDQPPLEAIKQYLKPYFNHLWNE